MEQETTGVRPWQWIVTVIVIIAIIVLGIYLFKGTGSAPAPVDTGTGTDQTGTNAPAGTNGVVIADQFPGNIAYISSVALTSPGFVVIKANNAGTPGAVIGSQYFKAGINPGQVTLSSKLVDGGVYYAQLYADTNGNGVFDASVDQPLMDASGNAIMKIFHASANAAANVKG